MPAGLCSQDTDPAQAGGSDPPFLYELTLQGLHLRIKALAAQKVQNVPLTRAQKVAAAAKEGK